MAPRLSVRRAPASGIRARPIGTLTQKIRCQEESLRERATDERTGCDADAADRRPHAERQAALLGREGLGQQRQGQRRDDRGADALEGPGGDQEADRGRQRCGRRRRR